MKTLQVKLASTTQGVKHSVINWLRDKKSANTTSDNAWWIYAGIVLGLLALGIAVLFVTNGFTAIGDWFLDAINGDTTRPNGWGSTPTTP